MQRILILVAILVALWAAPTAAQRSAILVGVDEGGGVRPLARAEGRTWSPTCDEPSSGPVRGTSQRPILAVSGNAAVEAIRYVPRGGVAWREVEPIVRRVFLLQERLEKVAPEMLVAIPTNIDSIATSVEPATRPIYYFTASKTIPNSRAADPNVDGGIDPRGDLRIDVVGWVRTGAAGASDKTYSLGTNTSLNWEQSGDRRAVARRTQLIPVGIVRIGNTGVWVMQGRAADSRWYSLYDVSIRGVQMVARSDAREC